MAIGISPIASDQNQNQEAPQPLPLASYPVSGLPWAANYPRCLVNILDTPQGLARSVDMGGGVWHWSSEVDGSDLGAGNVPTP